jgi:nitroreductase
MSVKLGTYEIVVSKLDIRQFKDIDVSNEIRLKILESARQVGTGLNSQHLRFILIDSKDMLQLLAEDSTSGGWVSGANFAIVILTNSDYGFKMLDAGRALQNMQLVAWSEGVGSGLFTGIRDEKMRTDFNIPEDLDIAVIVGFGYPSRKLTGMKKNRMSMNNILYHQRYGNP